MEIFTQVNAAFTIVGITLLGIVMFYIKDTLRDMKQVRHIPELIDKVSDLINKIDTLMIHYAVFEERIKHLESRLKNLELKLGEK